MSVKDISPPKPPPEPRALSPEYHKARKQLMLWSGILFIWQFIGIDLEKAKGTDGNVGAIVSALKSPQAVPWVLLILVGYFLFKVSIEWRQCNAARRAVREAKIDYASAWTVAIIACVLYAGQALARVQIADRIQSQGAGRVLSFIFGIATSLNGLYGIYRASKLAQSFLPQARHKKIKYLVALFYHPITTPLFGFGLVWGIGREWSWSAFATGAVAGLLAAAVMYTLFRFLLRRVGPLWPFV